MAVTAPPPDIVSVYALHETDSRQNVVITHGSAGSSNPISETLIDRRALRQTSDVVLPGIPSVTDWVRVATLKGKVSSWADKTTVANQGYVYRAYARNSKGRGAGKVSNAVYTTPAPAPFEATRTGSSTVVLSVVPAPAPGTTIATRFNVRDGESLIVSDVELPYTHTGASNSLEHAYTLQGHVEFEEQPGTFVVLDGPWSQPVTLPAGQAPAKPTGLAPVGGTPADVDVPFRWVHNPRDTTAQTAYELRYRVGVGAWTTLSGTTVDHRDVSLSVNLYEWQVRTKGAHANWSDWSDSALVRVTTRPTVTIVTPDTTYDSATLTVEWTYAQAESVAETGWAVRLYEDAVLLEELSAAGDATTASLATVLENLHTYTVEVVADAGGALSTPVDAEFSTVITPPPTPTIVGEWDEDLGVTVLTAEAGEGAPATVTLVIERSVAGGPWEPVDRADDVAFTVHDGECPSNASMVYRVSAYTALGGVASATVAVVSDSTSVWLSGGEGFLVTCRLPHSPEIDWESGRERSMVAHDGRSLPVVYAGTLLSRTISLSGYTTDAGWSELSASMRDMEALSQAAAPLHLFRDPDGNRVYGMLSTVRQPRKMLGLWGYSFALQEGSV